MLAASQCFLIEAGAAYILEKYFIFFLFSGSKQISPSAQHPEKYKMKNTEGQRELRICACE